MNELLLYNRTRQEIVGFIQNPSHALLLVAPIGSGKATIAKYIAGELLDVSVEKLAAYPYFKLVTSNDGKTISIDDIRAITHFMTRKVTVQKAAGPITRIVIIENGQLITTQAQNALLKTIEEPPEDTLLILTAQSQLALLPTIRSRVQQITIITPDNSTIVQYFEQQGYQMKQVQKALLMSGGLLGLMHALLEADSAHPLATAANTAHDILKKTIFERLVMIDELARQKQLWLDVLFMLRQMADIAIQQNHTDLVKVQRWQKVLSACYEANENTISNGQLKLVLLKFMLFM